MENRVRAALIGFGGMGQIYARMLHAGMVPEMALAGVCCRNEARQALLKAESPGVAPLCRRRGDGGPQRRL